MSNLQIFLITATLFFFIGFFFGGFTEYARKDGTADMEMEIKEQDEEIIRLYKSEEALREVLFAHGIRYPNDGNQSQASVTGQPAGRRSPRLFDTARDDVAM